MSDKAPSPTTPPAPAASPAIATSTVVRRSPEILEAELDGETVMMSVEKGEYYGLDEVGTAIWNLLDEPRSVAEVCAALVREYRVEPAVCERDVVAFLAELAADGSIELAEPGLRRAQTPSRPAGP